MRVCYFGDYAPGYARNRVLLRGLKLNHIEVIQCNTQKNGLKKYLDLYRQHKKIKLQYDVVIVGYQANIRLIVPLAKFLTNKPIVWDAFYSQYEDYVLERKYISKFSPKAFVYWFLDWLSCCLADKIVLDTNEHIKYFSELFKVDKDKFFRIFVGTDDSIFYPQDKIDHTKFIVHFHGNIIPLQGFEYILATAEILQDHKNIKFQVIGRRARIEKVIGLREMDNINIVDKVSYDILPKYIQYADICLGIFGQTAKTQRVIPNKVYEAAAMAKSIITTDTPAIKELFQDNENVLLCNPADAQDLADKILLLKNNSELREKIADGASKVYNSKVSTELIGIQLISILKKCL